MIKVQKTKGLYISAAKPLAYGPLLLSDRIAEYTVSGRYWKQFFLPLDNYVK